MIPWHGCRCVVAGGRGAVGAMLAQLLAGAGAEVCVVDPRLDPGLGLRDDIARPGPALRAALRRADVVVLAVPAPVALAALESLTAYMQPGSLLVDTLSVKVEFAAAVRRRAPSLRALGLNPMFAPSLGIAGRAVAAVPVHDGPRVQALLELLESTGARVVRLGAHEHDRLAAAAQALTHAAVLAFGLALAQLGPDAADLARLAPPPCVALLALLARISSGTPEVYWDVQASNGHSEAARGALAEGVRRLADVVASGDVTAFAELMSTAGDALGDNAGRYRALCAELLTDVDFVK